MAKRYTLQEIQKDVFTFTLKQLKKWVYFKCNKLYKKHKDTDNQDNWFFNHICEPFDTKNGGVGKLLVRCDKLTDSDEDLYDVIYRMAWEWRKESGFYPDDIDDTKPIKIKKALNKIKKKNGGG